MSIQADVIIVGAGPVGATLSLLLAREGASVFLTDKAAEIYPLPRAAHIDHEIVRVFQAVGAADAVMAASKATTYYDFLTASGEVLMRFGSADQKSPSGWPASNMIHQPSVEAVLRDVIAKTPLVELKTGVESHGVRNRRVGGHRPFRHAVRRTDCPRALPCRL